MKFKLDENIGVRGTELLRDAGYDVATVTEEKLGGAPDGEIFAAVVRESRALIMLDHDFGNVLRFPPANSSGIVVLEVAPRAQADTLLDRIRDLIAMLRERPLGAELWIVEPGRVRIHQSPGE